MSPHGSRVGGMSRQNSGYGGIPSYSGLYGQRFTSKLSSQEREIIAVAFDFFKDETGFITADKLREAFASNTEPGEAQKAGLEQIQELIDGIDENGDGKIDEEEFTHIMTKKFLGEDDDSSFIHAFEMLDANKDGFIPVAEFRHILMKEGQAPMSEQECDELLMFADLDGDGLVDYRNFLKWLYNPDALQVPRI